MIRRTFIFKKKIISFIIPTFLIFSNIKWTHLFQRGGNIPFEKISYVSISFGDWRNIMEQSISVGSIP